MERCTTSKVKASVPNQQNQQKKWRLEISFSKFFFGKDFKRKTQTLVLTLTYKVVYVTKIKSLSSKL